MPTESKTLRLPKKPIRTPHGLRFVDRKGRYILQERVETGVSGVHEWLDVPLIGSEEPAVVVKP